MSFKFVDLSGYMFTGKSAVSDVIREFKGFHVPEYTDEFDLIRIPGGLGDLFTSFGASWSPIRVDQALRRYEQVVKVMARNPIGVRRFYQEGFRYSKKYPGIEKRTEEFIQRITECQWDMPWPFAIVENETPPLKVFLRKVSCRLQGGRLVWPEIHHRIAGQNVFMREVRNYLVDVLSSAVKPNCHTIVTHNALEPFNPQCYFGLFDNIKCIAVDRDPRDIFATGAMVVPGYNDGDLRSSKRISGSFDPKVFVERFSILRSNTNYQHHPNILRINYESLINSYDQTVDEIYQFLEVSPSEHIWKEKFFSPAKSKQNVGLWKKYPNQKDIEIIAAAFPDRCK